MQEGGTIVLKGDALYKFPFSNLCEKDINTKKMLGMNAEI